MASFLSFRVESLRTFRLQGEKQSFVDSFASSSFLSWRLASQVGGLVSKLSSASVKSLSIIGRNGGEGGPPYFNGKGGIAVSQPLLSLQSSGFHSQEVGIGVNR
ncbi:hypothetical protein KY289_006307 [Solanum tuberosum]|nr:hypothetical protein KY289_006307 [Solanum tuberosum]